MYTRKGGSVRAFLPILRILCKPIIERPDCLVIQSWYFESGTATASAAFPVDAFALCCAVLGFSPYAKPIPAPVCVANFGTLCGCIKYACRKCNEQMQSFESKMGCSKGLCSIELARCLVCISE